MPSVAFLAASGLGLSSFQPQSAALSRNRPRRFTVQRRVRCAGSEKLYPDPDPIEPIENPVTPQPPTPEPSETPQSLFDKLNSRRQNPKPDPDVVVTSLDAANDMTQPLFERGSDETAVSTEAVKPDQRMDYERAARALWRVGWATWWLQLILTVISGVILLFSFAFPGVNVRSSASAVGFIVSGVGVVFAFLSLFSTYSYTRLSLWLSGNGGRGNRTAETAQTRISRRLRVGLLISIIGMVVSLTGLQAIVGTLLARLLSAGIATTPYNSYQMAQGVGSVAPGSGLVQPVDVLVIQASANAMMGLVAALATTVWLRARSKKWQQ